MVNEKQKPKPPRKRKRKWTVMIYLAGDNNLSSEMIWSIKEMKRVNKIGPREPITVLVLFDPPPNLPAQAYVITHGDKDNKLIREAKLAAIVNKGKKGGAKTLALDPGKSSTVHPINTGDPGTLFQFISYGLEKYDAERYMVVLSGHGSGADEDFLLKDDSARDSLTIRELKDVFTAVKQKLKDEEKERVIDILGLDSCLMSMAEVYYELANIEKPNSDGSSVGELDTTGLGNVVDFVVGAEGFELSAGWPYERVLSALARSPGMNAETYATKIVEAYILYYSDYALSGQSVDLAACDLRNGICNDLKQKVAGLADTLNKYLKNKKFKDAVLLAHYDAQSYKFDQYTDLFDFCRLLEERCDNATVKKACNGVMEVIGKIVKNSCYSGPAVQHSYGLSVYFPWNRISPHYQCLDFARGTGWDRFLFEYVNKTRRPSRNQDCSPETGSVEEMVFKPKSVEAGTAPNDSTPQGIRFTAPDDRFTAPDDRGLRNRSGSMKNPPIEWCPCVCTSAEKEASG